MRTISNLEPSAQRQYTIKYQRGGSPAIQLEPGVNADLYARSEVAFGIAFMQAHPFVELLAVRLGDEAFLLAALLPGNSHANGRAYSFDSTPAPSIIV